MHLKQHHSVKQRNVFSKQIHLVGKRFILKFIKTQPTSCDGGRHNMPPSLQVDNIFVFIRQVAGLFWHVGYLRHQQQV